MLGQVCINQAFSEANPWHLQTKSNIRETTYLWPGLQEETTVRASIVHCCRHVNYSLFAII